MARWLISIYLITNIAIFILSPTMLYAGNRAGATTLSLGGGYYFFADKRHLDDTNIPYGALAYNFSERFGIEGLAGFFTTTSHKSINLNRSVRGKLFVFDGIYRFFPSDHLEPFLLLGVGVLGLNPNGTDAHDEGNVNAGIGVQYFIDRSIAFRFEARDFYTLVGGKNDAFLDAGISFLFG